MNPGKKIKNKNIPHKKISSQSNSLEITAFQLLMFFKALKTEEKKCKYPFSGAFQIPLIQGDFQIFAGLQWAIEVKV